MGPPITRSISFRPISATESYRLTTTVTRSRPYRWRRAAAMRLAPRTVDSSWFATTTIVVASSRASSIAGSERGTSSTTHG